MQTSVLLMLNIVDIIWDWKKGLKHWFLFTVSTSNTTKLHGYSGFDPTLCYGDILLSYTWSSSNPTQPTVDTSNSPTNNSNNAKKMSEDSIKVQPLLLGVDGNDKKLHDFMRTHFHRATQCDFCSKKVKKQLKKISFMF